MSLDDDGDQPPPRRNAKGFVLLGGLLVATAALSYALRPEDVREPPAELPGRTAPADSFTVDFADPQHGFAVRHSCNGRLPGCWLSLLVTDDGGHNWGAEQPLPESVNSPGRSSARLSALGGCALAIDAQADDPTKVFRIFSDDCGGHWRRVPLRVDGEVSSIPPGATLERCRIEVTIDYCSTGVVVTLPDSGRRVRLNTVPALDPLLPEKTPLEDGTWWLSGREPKTGQWSIAESRDDGRHWQLRELPEQPTQRVEAVRVTGLRVGDLYATFEGHPRYGLVAIYRSADSGGHWQQTWRADTREPPRLPGTAMATTGGLLVTGEGSGSPQAWRSRDHGRTFTSPYPTDPRGTATRTRGGYLVHWSDAGRWYRSANGTGWSPMAFPPD